MDYTRHKLFWIALKHITPLPTSCIDPFLSQFFCLAFVIFTFPCSESDLQVSLVSNPNLFHETTKSVTKVTSWVPPSFTITSSSQFQCIGAFHIQISPNELTGFLVSFVLKGICGILRIWRCWECTEPFTVSFEMAIIPAILASFLNWLAKTRCIRHWINTDSILCKKESFFPAPRSWKDGSSLLIQYPSEFVRFLLNQKSTRGWIKGPFCRMDAGYWIKESIQFLPDNRSRLHWFLLF